MTRKLFSHLGAFVAGAAIFGTAVYFYHVSHQLDIVYRFVGHYESINGVPLNKDLWSAAIEDAQTAVRSRLHIVYEGPHGPVVRLIAEEPCSYEALIIGSPSFLKRVKEIDKIIDDEIVKAMDANTKRALDILKKNNEQPTEQNNPVRSATPAHL
jgi:hypothetical protein